MPTVRCYSSVDVRNRHFAITGSETMENKKIIEQSPVGTIDQNDRLSRQLGLAQRELSEDVK